MTTLLMREKGEGLNNSSVSGIFRPKDGGGVEHLVRWGLAVVQCVPERGGGQGRAGMW